MLTAVAQGTEGWQALQCASGELWADREFALAMVAFFLARVALNGLALECAPDVLRADKGVVLAAVRQNGAALEWKQKPVRQSLHCCALPTGSESTGKSCAAVAQDVAALEFAEGAHGARAKQACGCTSCADHAVTWV